MKCPKRRSQRKITFFINRDKQQTKNNVFIHLHVNQELLLSHSGYIYRTGRGGCDNQNDDALFFNLQTFSQLPCLYRNRARSKNLWKRNILWESLFECVIVAEVWQSMFNTVHTCRTVSAESC